MIFNYGILLLMLIHPLVEAAIKKWVKNTNYNNPNNWDTGRLPCQDDRVIFPESIPAVYIQANTSIMEMVLPSNGEIILADYMSITAVGGQSTDPNCLGEDITFLSPEPASWFDPDSWCETADLEGACMTNQPPRLETENIPCNGDTVVFPKDSTFLVDLGSGVDISMAKLKVGGKDQSTGSFRQFVESQEGKRIFKRSGGQNPTTITVQNQACNSPSGCTCFDDLGQMAEAVCDIVTDACEPAECQSSILPLGGCCEICGAILKLDYSDSFRIKKLNTLIKREIPNDLLSQVIVSKTPSEKIQIVIKDVTGDGRASKSAQILFQKLQQDIDGQNRYQITEVKLTKSGKSSSNPNTAAQTGGAEMSTGSITGLVFAIIIILGVVGLGMFCFMDRQRLGRCRIWRTRFRMPKFVKFMKSESSAGLEMDVSVGYKDPIPPGYDEFVQGFDNPMYGGDKNSAEGGGTRSSIDATQATFDKSRSRDSDSSGGFNNPMYMQSQPGAMMVIGPQSNGPQTNSIGPGVDADITELQNELQVDADNTDLQHELEDILSGSEDIESVSANGFVNPMYDKKDANVTAATGIRFSNPMFSEDGLGDDSEI